MHACDVLSLGVATETPKLRNLLIIKLAEREGFEPPVPCGTPDFESKAGMLIMKRLQTVEMLSVGR